MCQHPNFRRSEHPLFRGISRGVLTYLFISDWKKIKGFCNFWGVFLANGPRSSQIGHRIRRWGGRALREGSGDLDGGSSKVGIVAGQVKTRSRRTGKAPAGVVPKVSETCGAKKFSGTKPKRCIPDMRMNIFIHLPKKAVSRRFETF